MLTLTYIPFKNMLQIHQQTLGLSLELTKHLSRNSITTALSQQTVNIKLRTSRLKILREN